MTIRFHWIVALFLTLLSLAGCGGPGSTSVTTYSISGSISNYSGSNLELSDGARLLAITSGDTSFAFSGISNGSTYSIAVSSQPTSPVQSCTIINGNGTVSGADITNVQVNCVTDSYTVSGSVSGLSGTGLVLQNNGGDDLNVTSSNFVFSTPVANESTYAVTILAQPTGQTCTVSNGSGTMGTANVTNVQVSCVVIAPVPSTFTIGGSISGLSGTGLVLQNNGGDNLAFNPDAAVSTFAFNTPVADSGTYIVTVLSQPNGQTCSINNASGTVSSANVTNVEVICADIPTYTVGGSVSGLTGSGLVLQDNGGDNLAIGADGAFVFGTPLTDSSPYSVTVFAQPSGHTCSVSNASGTIASANVSNVQVNCVANTYSISGTVSGLTGAGLVLQNNGGDNLAIGANGGFTFGTPIASGNTYSVTVSTKPNGQTCAVSNGGGTVTSAPITNVQISCTDNPSYAIGGTVSGLSGSGLVLQNNGGDNLAIGADGTFTFNTAIASGNVYSVTVLTHPSGQVCTISNGGGTVASADVSNVQVNCVTPDFTIGGNVSGLTGSGLVLQNNGGDNLAIGADGTFTFSTPLPDLSSYSVSVLSQPSGQNCALTNESGALAGANVTNIQVTCTTIPTYTVGGTVSGLTGSGLVLQDNGGDDLAINADGAFSFATKVADNNTYSVTVLTQPSNQTCSVSNGGGTIAGTNVADVLVNCITNTYSISGSVSGLSGSGLVLQNNGGDSLAISGNGNFTFNTAIASGNTYSVTVFTQPGGQTCTVSNGSGSVTNSAITNVAVSCINNSYTISGTVNGPLSGDALPGPLILQNNGGDDLVINGYGIFTFPTSVTSGLPYNVTVLQQPAADWTCLPSSSSGVVGTANVSNIAVNCVNNSAVPTGSPGTARRSHTATLLDDGRVLVAGGWNTDSTTPLTSATIFDQTAASGVGAFTATGSMGTARTSHTATLLADGTVLMIGGWDNSGNLSSAEIFDPAANAGAGAFLATGSMHTVRAHHTAARLTDNKVLVTGGYGSMGYPIASAELFDPGTGTFSYTSGSMGDGRIFHTATVLIDGTVLITGGQDQFGGLLSAEIYNPTTGTFSATGNMSTIRYKHTATLLSDGKVLIVGGAQGSDNPIASAEVYDPATGTFRTTGSMAVARADHTATLLANGKVLIAGGRKTLNDLDALDSTEIYDPASGRFTNGGSLGSAHTDHTATLLNSPAYVLITGGYDGTSTVYYSELYVP